MMTIKDFSKHQLKVCLVLALAASMTISGYAQANDVSKGSFAYDLLDVSPKSHQVAGLAASPRRSGDELEDCMNNPSNADQDYIERLGNCFCLVTDNAEGSGC